MTAFDAATGQLKFFVSYTKADRAWAEWIAWQIESAGHEVKIQAWDFAPGSNFVSEMDKASKWSDVTMPVLSPDFAKSEFGEAEWTAVFAKDPLGRKGRLVPARVREFELDGLLASLVYIDLVGLGKDAARDQLVRGLKRGRRKPEAEPDFPPDLEGATSAPAHEPVFPGKPHPKFSSDRSRDLSLQLAAATALLKERVKAKQPADDARQTIRDLKNRMREGGQLEAGDTLCDGRYELLEAVGQGGFAHVWRAWDSEQIEQVAIKVLHGRYAKDQSRIDRFKRGARQMKLLSHPSVVRLVDEPREDHSYHFFVMEYVEGGDLRDAVKSGRLLLADRWQIVLSIGKALQYAHEKGIIHRDVKPGNILLDGKEQAKLTDFDLARAGDTSGGTRTGMLGTVVYAAPEMLHHPQNARPAVDVYGLGMTAIFALHGEDLPLDVFRDAARYLAGLEATEDVKAVLAKAVEWEEEQRFVTVGEFCEALRRALEPSPRVEEGEQDSEPPQETVSEAKTTEELALSDKRTAAFAQSPKLEAVLAELKRTGNLEKRAKIFEGIPDQLGKADACLGLVEQLKGDLRNGFDLFWLWWIVEEVERRWRVGSRAQEVLGRFFDHIPPPQDPELLWRIKTPRDGRVELWRKIPAGKGWIGSPDNEKGRDDDERPRHRVEILQPFAMAAAPITNAQYSAFDPDKAFHKWRGVSNKALLSHPRVNVTWYEAVSFCRWLGTLPGFAGTAPRLPVEEEWEYACRAGTATRYWSGDSEEDLERVGWFGEGYESGTTHRVGQKPANPWRLYDMHGNVREWTSTEWDTKRYQGRSPDEPHPIDPLAADLAASPRVWRVLRGGSCWSSARGCRSAYRDFWLPGVVFRNLGFRVLLSSVPSRSSKFDPGS